MTIKKRATKKEVLTEKMDLRLKKHHKEKILKVACSENISPSAAVRFMIEEHKVNV